MIIVTGPRCSDKTQKPILKWAGGKRWLVPQLQELWLGNEHRRFVDPFCGACAPAFGLAPCQALLNDANFHVVNFHRWVQCGLQITLEMRDDKSLYYTHRDRFNALVSPKAGLWGPSSKKAAELFYYLNKTGFNGLCRFNRKGQFNVPFGRHQTINYQRDFAAYERKLENWTFTSADFETLDTVDSDFIYADPPYDESFSGYTPEGFTWADQERLAKWLSKHPGPVVASNRATKRITELYSALGFHLKPLKGPRNINCTGDRTPVGELIMWKAIPDEARRLISLPAPQVIPICHECPECKGVECPKIEKADRNRERDSHETSQQKE